MINNCISFLYLLHLSSLTFKGYKELKLYCLLVMTLLQAIPLSAQDTNAVNEEEMTLQYINQAWMHGVLYDSLTMIPPAIDSGWQFLRKYPQSWVRPSLFLMMWRAQSAISTDTTKIYPLIDSILMHDSSAVTMLDIGEDLIERRINLTKGKHFVESALLKLTAIHHKYRAHLSLAQVDIAEGSRASAMIHFSEALSLEPKRQEAWYNCLAFLKVSEQREEYDAMLRKFKKLERDQLVVYREKVESSINIGENVADLYAFRLDHRQYNFSSLIGHPGVFVIFDFYCGYCLQELRFMKSFIREFPQVKFIFVDVLDTREELTDIYFKKEDYLFMKNQNVVMDDSNLVYDMAMKSGSGVPHTFLIDKAGKIRYDFLGFDKNTPTMIREKLVTLIKQ
jgi:hypothetical protein